MFRRKMLSPPLHLNRTTIMNYHQEHYTSQKRPDHISQENKGAEPYEALAVSNHQNVCIYHVLVTTHKQAHNSIGQT